MYFLSFVGVILISAYLLLLSTGFSGLIYFLDIPSALTVLLFTVTLLLGAGLLKDFNNAFRLAVRSGKRKEEAVSAAELRRALEAVRLARNALLAGGVFSFLFSVILTLHLLETPEQLGPILAVGILAPLYGLAAALLLLPLEAKLRIESGEREKE